MEKKNVITFGSSLAALQYAYEHKTKIILNKLNFPPPFEPSYIKHAWGLLYTKLMLDGQTIGGDIVKMTSILDDEIIVVCEGNVINKLKYDLLIVFDDKNVIGLPEVLEETDKYTVIDILIPKSLVVSNKETIIETNDNLVNKLYVLKPAQTRAATIYSVSDLNKKQLQNFDYSDTMVKFKSEDLLKENGFLGDCKSRDKILLEVIERIVQKKMDKYKDTEKVKFIYGTSTRYN